MASGLWTLLRVDDGGLVIPAGGKSGIIDGLRPDVGYGLDGLEARRGRTEPDGKRNDLGGSCGGTNGHGNESPSQGRDVACIYIYMLERQLFSLP